MSFNLTKLVKVHCSLLALHKVQMQQTQQWRHGKEKNSLRFTSIHFTFQLISNPRTRKDCQCHPPQCRPTKTCRVSHNAATLIVTSMHSCSKVAGNGVVKSRAMSLRTEQSASTLQSALLTHKLVKMQCSLLAVHKVQMHKYRQGRNWNSTDSLHFTSPCS